MRRLLKRERRESFVFTGDYGFTLREYPVRQIDSITETSPLTAHRLNDPECYDGTPVEMEDVPYTVIIHPPQRWAVGKTEVRVDYTAGYEAGEVPPDLGSACLELAAWNMNRYRGRRIGMTGAVRGSGKDGEHFEVNMPENVRGLLEAYRRRVI
jgi:hypothetical protein